MKTLALIALLLIGATTAQAASIEIGPPSNVRLQNGQWWFFPPGGNYTPPDTLPALENNSRDISVPTSKGRLPVTINQKTPVSINNLGKAAVNLAKRAGPLGVGLTLAWELCDIADVCAFPSDPENPASAPIWTQTDPDNKPMPYVRYKLLTNLGGDEFSTYTEACDVGGERLIQNSKPPSGGWASGEVIGCVLFADVQPRAVISFVSTGGFTGESTQHVADRIQNCPSTHTLIGPTCHPKNPTRVPVTPGAWDTAENLPGLNSPDIIPDLIEGGEPIPLDTPEIEPKTVPGPGGSTTETIRNGQGQPIGTKTTDTTVTISPSGPTTVSVTENTTTTETNITNNTTTITTTETTLPNNEDQSEKPKEDTDLDIDDVPDTDISTYEIPDTFAYDSWGGGSCPGDPTITAKGYAYNLPVHKVCEAMTDMRPGVLLIAAVVSAFIISGAFRQ